MRDIKDVYLLALQNGMLATHARKALSLLGKDGADEGAAL